MRNTESAKNLKILLLNPPGDKIYLRDYYCSKVSKANYIYEPPDLVILSGYLYGVGYDVKVIDAIVSGLSFSKCIHRILKFNPDIIIFITGSVSYKSDFRFLSKMKSLLPKIRMVGSGDLFMEKSDEILERTSFLDAIILDFTTNDILKYIKGEKPDNMIYRKGNKIVQGKVKRERFTEFDIPIPRHELFPLKRYNYPFVKKSLFATVLTDYGCPFRCSFCIMSKIGFKLRTVDNVIKELKHIKNLGISEIYFDDQTFGAHKKRFIELCNAIIKNKLNIGWVCFSRVDVVDEDMLKLMKRAGCHTIMFGVESGNQEILNQAHKGLKKEKIEAVFRLCRKLGLRTLATYMIGLPGDTKKTIKETIRFSKNLNSDFASFNIPVPRMGTDLRKESLEKGIINEDFYEMDQSGSKAVLRTDKLNLKQITFYKNYAVLSYYFRPSYLLTRLRSVRSWEDIKVNLRGIAGIIKNLF